MVGLRTGKNFGFTRSDDSKAKIHKGKTRLNTSMNFKDLVRWIASFEDTFLVG